MSPDLVTTITNNRVAILATDTLYGIVGNAQDKEVVERIYDIKGRDEHKPFIILISSIDMLAHFGVAPIEADTEKLLRWWPGPVTVILPIKISEQERLAYLHRGTNELAFRLPAKDALRSLIQQTGPIVAPSANPQGQEPAHTITEAQAYFGDAIDWYEDRGVVNGAPSTIVRLHAGEMTVIRQGATIVV